MLPPLRFRPLYMQRVWGGRMLESLYGRALPTAADPYGESWEMVDREGEQSIVTDGAFAGQSLHELWTHHRAEIFGQVADAPRFPLLLKVLDARDDLSIQVHPPADVAPSLGGEPKTEMWYIAHADPGAKLYVGQKEGVTKADFEQALVDGTGADTVHAIEPQAGDSIFIPSGRLHAIGAGLVIYEIQQNSDTTYRVFDWNRVGLDGQPRDLHVEESLKCIDFDDIEPAMDVPDGDVLASCEYFRVERHTIAAGATLDPQTAEKYAIISVVDGVVEIGGVELVRGDFALLPVGSPVLAAAAESQILLTRGF